MDQTESGQRCVVVLGMHRSGTSAIARVINLLGVDLGDRFLPPRPDNPEGYWENVDIYHIHERLLNGLGRVWNSLFPFPDNWWQSQAAAPHRRDLVEAIQRNFGSSPVWGFKDPRVCRLLPVWNSLLSELRCRPYYIYVFRNPFEVARSLGKRDKFSVDKSLLLWLQHTLESERDSRLYPIVFITYDELLVDWRSTITKISKTLGLEWPRPISEAAEEIESFLRPDLRHHRESDKTWDTTCIFADELRRAYEALLAASTGAPSGLRKVFDSISESLAQKEALLPRELVVEDLQSLRLRLIETDSWVTIRDAEIVRRDSEIARRDGEIAYRDAEIVRRDGEIAHRDAEIVRRDAEIARRDAEIEAMRRSRSWRWTAPLRDIWNLMGR